MRPNTFNYTTLLIVLALVFSSCDKDKTGSENKTYSGGRVVLVNSDTPVPEALVRFLKLVDSGSWVQSYNQVGTATTDANGYFDAPINLDADIARAYGLDSIYENPSYDVGYGDNMRIELVPPAWLSISAEDVEPLNPEVLYVKVYTNNPITDWQNVNGLEPLIVKCVGNQATIILYYLAFDNENIQSQSLQFILEPFDTTSYTIQY